jgi:hypothetical protein
MKTITKFTLLAILFAIPSIGYAQSKDKKQRIIDANPSLYYPFEDVATAANPLVGDLPLKFFTATDNNKSPGDPGGNPGEAEGPYEGKGAVLIPYELHVQVPNPIVPEDEDRLNTFTLLYDFNYPPLTRSWVAIFQGNENNSDDEDICIRGSDHRIGIGTPGYAEKVLSPDTWYRFVATFSFDEDGVGTQTLYLDGELIQTKIGGSNLNAKNGRFSIADVFYIFSDENGDEDDIKCAGFAFWGGKALTAEDVKTLGGFAYEGSPFAEKPVLIAGKRTVIQAENFDKGGSDIAYKTTTTATNAYREEAVKIEAGPGNDNYHLVTENGDWFNYSLSVSESADGYDYIFYFYGQKTTGNYFSILVNGVPVEDATDVEFPASYNDPVELSVPLTLKPGNNLITIQSKGGNLDKFEAELYSPFPPLNPDKKQRIVDANPTLYYPFESVATAAEPLIGDFPLTFYTGDGTTPAGTLGGEPLPALNVPYAGKGAVLVKRGLHVQVQNPNSTTSDGGTRLNTWTLLYDINYPPMLEKPYIALFQANGEDGGDVDICIRNSDKKVGIGTTGYSGKEVFPDIWYRLIITLYYNESGVSTYKVYANGVEILSSSAPKVDDRFSIGDNFWLFLDDVGDENDLNVAGFAFWANHALTADEVRALGGIGYEGSPFESNIVPGFIQAEKYDIGGEGESFHVVNPVEDNTYRPGDATNIAAGPEGDYHLVTGDGDWYNYTISVPESKTGYEYIFKFYGQKTSGNYFSVIVNGVSDENTTNVDFPVSYNEPVELAAPIKLKPGNNLITIRSSGGNLDKFEFEKVPYTYEGMPYYGDPYLVSLTGETTIEAEDYNLGGEGIAYHDFSGGTSGNQTAVYRTDGIGVQMETHTDAETGEAGINIAWSSAGEWVSYSIQVEDAGNYDFFISLASDNSDRRNHLEVDETVYPTVILKTASWTTYKNHVLAENVPLTVGKHTLYIYYDGNFDKFTIKKNATAIQFPDVLSGKVYAENGILKVKGFRTSASLAVYNLLGQKITAYKSLNGDVEISLPAKGIYIVKIQDEGITSNYKVIVK